MNFQSKEGPGGPQTADFCRSMETELFKNFRDPNSLQDNYRVIEPVDQDHTFTFGQESTLNSVMNKVKDGFQ